MSAEHKLIIFAGPSGSGKTTIAHHLLRTIPKLSFSISATTRLMRPFEENGKDYHFLTNDEFKQRLENNEFIEYEEVYKGVFYGTLKSEIQRIWTAGGVPVLDIDVYGALNIKKNFATKALTVFVHPVSVDNIKARLKQRATESEESYLKRVHKAEEELGQAVFFDEIIYNEVLEDALIRAEEIVQLYISGQLDPAAKPPVI